MKKTKRIQQIIVLVLIAAAIASYFLVEPVKTTLDQIFSMFATGDFAVVKDFVESYGPYAMAVSALLMIFQSLMAPLPAFLITFANANLVAGSDSILEQCNGGRRFMFLACQSAGKRGSGKDHQ